MRMILEVQSGTQQGRKVHLATGQRVTFGRTECADVAFDDDVKMSGTHFALESDPNGCRLLDLESTNGTQVGDTFVKQAILRDGDQITAGRTQFVVHIGDATKTSGDLGTGAPPANGAHAVSAAAIVPDRARTVQQAGVGPIACTMEQLPSGLASLRGGTFGQPEEPPTPSALAVRLGETVPLTAIVDIARLEDPPADGLEGTVPLYDWIPAEVARVMAPRIVSPGVYDAIDGLVDSAWDRDAIVCLFSRQDAEPLIAHLRDALHFNAEGVRTKRDASRGILGYCWPGVLAQLLTNGSPRLVDRLLQGIEAVLLEVAAEPGSWQLFARPESVAALRQIGFSAREDNPGGEEQEER